MNFLHFVTLARTVGRSEASADAEEKAELRVFSAQADLRLIRIARRESDTAGVREGDNEGDSLSRIPFT